MRYNVCSKIQEFHIPAVTWNATQLAHWNHSSGQSLILISNFSECTWYAYRLYDDTELNKNNSSINNSCICKSKYSLPSPPSSLLSSLPSFLLLPLMRMTQKRMPQKMTPVISHSNYQSIAERSVSRTSDPFYNILQFCINLWIPF